MTEPADLMPDTAEFSGPMIDALMPRMLEKGWTPAILNRAAIAESYCAGPNMFALQPVEIWAIADLLLENCSPDGYPAEEGEGEPADPDDAALLLHEAPSARTTLFDGCDDLPPPRDPFSHTERFRRMIQTHFSEGKQARMRRTLARQPASQNQGSDAVDR